MEDEFVWVMKFRSDGSADTVKMSKTQYNIIHERLERGEWGIVAENVMNLFFYADPDCRDMISEWDRPEVNEDAR
jgi:hypothetical protein